MLPDRLVDADEMRGVLRAALLADPERSPVAYLRYWLRDPAALDAAGHHKLHPMWMALFLLGALALCVFVSFTLFGN